MEECTHKKHKPTDSAGSCQLSVSNIFHFQIIGFVKMIICDAIRENPTCRILHVTYFHLSAKCCVTCWRHQNKQHVVTNFPITRKTNHMVKLTCYLFRWSQVFQDCITFIYYNSGGPFQRVNALVAFPVSDVSFILKSTFTNGKLVSHSNSHTDHVVGNIGIE